jgi:hypothetical protein
MSEVIIGEKKEDDSGLIIHPFSEDVNTEVPITMHIVGSIGATYIGGVIGDLAQYVDMFLPLMMIEAPQRDGSFGLGLRPLFMSFGLLDIITVKHDFIYALKNVNSRDKALVDAYEKQITSFRAQELGMVSPTNEDVLKINKR